MSVKEKAKAFEGKYIKSLVYDSRLTLRIADIFGGCFYENRACTTLDRRSLCYFI